MTDATTTDLYEVTMAMSYLREGMTGPATFSLFVRDLPPERGFLDAGTTTARVVLDTGTTALTGHGAAHCHPADTNVPEIDDELAVGRAMEDLAHQLLNTAERDIEGVGVSRPENRQISGWPS
ncbi:dsRBD fold-containing protein [Streptomyces sp. NPDC052023]|uniref:DUF1876 domain-containing protein n=1 Tax=Streptomyces sp. NPDC052023 TaxID=3365681 RepID=UPI0037CFA4E4